MDSREVNNVVDELGTLSDGELQSCFGEDLTCDEILSKYPITYISEKLDGFVRGIIKPVKGDAPIEADSATLPLDVVLRRTTGYTKAEVLGMEKNYASIKGVIVWYDPKRSLGLILKRGNKIRKVYFQGDALSWSKRKELRAGDKVSFDLKWEESLDCANAVNIVKFSHAKTPEYLYEPENLLIRTRNILRFGKHNALKQLTREKGVTLKDIEQNGYSYHDLDYVFIKTPSTEYRIFREGSPIKGDGQVSDLDQYLIYLDANVLGVGMVSAKKIRDQEHEISVRLAEDKKQALRYYILGYLCLYGLNDRRAKQVLQQNGFEKALRKGRITLEDNPSTVAKLYLPKDAKPSGIGNKRRALHNFIRARYKEGGVSEKEFKERLNAMDFNHKLEKGFYDDLLAGDIDIMVLAEDFVVNNYNSSENLVGG